MKKDKREKLVVVSPSGEQYTIGFLSPCKDGFVIGTSHIEDEPNAHLTILKKDGEISSHITTQSRLSERQWFPPSTINDISRRVQSLLEQEISVPVSDEELSQQVMYLTQKLADWFNTLMRAIYYQEVSKKEIIHVIDLKSGFEAIPKLFETIKNCPEDFFGFCKLSELLSDKTKIVGITNSKKLILPVEDTLIGIDLYAFLGADFDSNLVSDHVENSLTELYKSLGLSQYIDQEVVQKRFFEKLFSKDAETKDLAMKS